MFFPRVSLFLGEDEQKGSRQKGKASKHKAKGRDAIEGRKSMISQDL